MEEDGESVSEKEKERQQGRDLIAWCKKKGMKEAQEEAQKDLDNITPKSQASKAVTAAKKTKALTSELMRVANEEEAEIKVLRDRVISADMKKDKHMEMLERLKRKKPSDIKRRWRSSRRNWPRR